MSDKTRDPNRGASFFTNAVSYEIAYRGVYFVAAFAIFSEFFDIATSVDFETLSLQKRMLAYLTLLASLSCIFATAMHLNHKGSQHHAMGKELNGKSYQGGRTSKDFQRKAEIYDDFLKLSLLIAIIFAVLQIWFV